MSYTYELVQLQPALFGLKVSKDELPLQFEAHRTDILITEVFSNTPIRCIHDFRDDHHKEAMWILVGGRTYAMREKDLEDDIHVITPPFPRRQELVRRVGSSHSNPIRPQKARRIPPAQAQLITQFLRDHGF